MKLQSPLLVFVIIFLTGTCLPSSAKPHRLPRQLINWVLKDVCSSGCAPDELADYRHNIRFELHDLNGDNIPEFFVYIHHSDLCGNHFNCEYSIFQRRGNGYRLIASSLPALRMANTVTQGYRDLESRHDIGVCPFRGGTMGRDVFVTVLRYNGTEYKPTELGEQCREPIPRPASRVGRRIQQIGWTGAGEPLSQLD
jgi:hypothetical protein